MDWSGWVVEIKGWKSVDKNTDVNFLSNGLEDTGYNASCVLLRIAAKKKVITKGQQYDAIKY